MMNPEESSAKYDAYKKRRAAGEEVIRTPAEAVEFISELRRRQKPITHSEFWEMIREGRTHNCDNYFEDKQY